MSSSYPTAPNRSSEIEITPEMIEAGLNALEESGRLEFDRVMSGDQFVVERVFRAMWSHCLNTVREPTGS